MPQSVDGGLRAVVQIRFAENVANTGFDGLLTDDQVVSVLSGTWPGSKPEDAP